jgi:uncharacterized protein
MPPKGISRQKIYNLTTFQGRLAPKLKSLSSNVQLAWPALIIIRMKLQPDKSNSLTINAYGPGWIEVNAERFTSSLIVSSLAGASPQKWQARRFEDLGPSDFDVLASSGAELVLFGSGQRLRFPRPVWLSSLIYQGIGMETMDTAAACRTYNILASEGRKVVVALLMES